MKYNDENKMLVLFYFSVVSVDITSVKMCAYLSLRVSLSENKVMYVNELVDVCLREYAFLKKGNGVAHNATIIAICTYAYLNRFT